jgi:hypothetical protein
VNVNLMVDLASVKIAPDSTDRIKVEYVAKERLQ